MNTETYQECQIINSLLMYNMPACATSIEVNKIKWEKCSIDDIKLQIPAGTFKMDFLKILTSNPDL